MGYSPAGARFGHGYQISPDSFESIGAYLSHIAQGGTGSSAAWPLANLALFCPFDVYSPVTITEAYWENGATAGGNIDIGIYDEAGNRIVSLGTTARGSVSVLVTSTTLTATTLFPGRYYMAMSHDGTSNIFGIAPTAGLLQAAGVCEMASAFPLPATATLAATTRAYLPKFGLLVKSTALPA
jgi:hypothetical protein